MTDSKKNIPIASILIPVFNEEKYISDCLNSIIKNEKSRYDFEILIIDGGSTDKTLEIIKEYTLLYPYIKYLKNEKKYIPDALNLGIKESKSKYIIRLDAHAHYSTDYINNCIQTIEESEVEIVNVGGIIKSLSLVNNAVSDAIADIMSSKFGVGNSIFRVATPKKSIFVETVPFGCFKRSIFNEIGLFNIDQHRNEDLEFNHRILKANKKILLNPNIISTYYVRDNYSDLIKQQFHNGYIVTNRFSLDGLFHRVRHYVPLLWVSYIFISIFILFFSKSSSGFYYNTIIYSWILYGLVINLLSVYYSVIKKKINKIMYIPITIIIIHGAYGIGSIFGVLHFFKNFFLKEKSQ